MKSRQVGLTRRQASTCGRGRWKKSLLRNSVKPQPMENRREMLGRSSSSLAILRWRIVSCSWELMAASRADSCSIFTPLLCPVFFAFSAVSHQ